MQPTTSPTESSVNTHDTATGLVPHTRKWLEYWDRQFYLYMTGQDHNAIWLSSIAAYRAVMKHAGEEASSLVRKALCENNS